MTASWRSLDSVTRMFVFRDACGGGSCIAECHDLSKLHQTSTFDSFHSKVVQFNHLEHVSSECPFPGITCKASMQFGMAVGLWMQPGKGSVHQMPSRLSWRISVVNCGFTTFS